MKLKHFALVLITIIFLSTNANARYLEQMRKYEYVNTRPAIVENVHRNAASPSITSSQYKDGMNLYEAFASNPALNIDSYGLLCAFREYREQVLHGGGIPHGGILLGLEDIDFGPAYPYAPKCAGKCPYRHGGPTWGSTITWDLEIKKTGKIKYGHPDRPLCCCVTCSDVQTCVRKTCQEWNLKDFHFIKRNCWSFVRAVKKNCCLKRKTKP